MITKCHKNCRMITKWSQNQQKCHKTVINTSKILQITALGLPWMYKMAKRPKNDQKITTRHSKTMRGSAGQPILHILICIKTYIRQTTMEKAQI